MASLSELVDAIARLEGLDPPNVALIARYVREAGLITKRGRGLSAAKMTTTDAARLLIAVNTSHHAAVDAASAVVTYGRLVAGEMLTTPGPGPLRLSASPRLYGTLEETVALLISAAGARALPPTFLRREVPQKLLEAFTKELVHMELKFRTSTPQASLRMTALENPDSVLRLMAEEMIDVPPEWTLSFVFVHDRPPIRGPDRREETTIGYPTLRAVGQLIQ